MHIKDLPTIAGSIKREGKIEFVVVPFGGLKRLVRSLLLDGQLDERAYLKRYPDVQRAIDTGKYLNATDHYLSSGYAEGREAKIKH
jgi:hypothetical protein